MENFRETAAAPNSSHLWIVQVTDVTAARFTRKLRESPAREEQGTNTGFLITVSPRNRLIMEEEASREYQEVNYISKDRSGYVSCHVTGHKHKPLKTSFLDTAISILVFFIFTETFFFQPTQNNYDSNSLQPSSLTVHYLPREFLQAS